MIIQTIGFKILKEEEKSDFEKLFNEYSRKINRFLKGVSSYIIHVKEYNKEGTRKKYSIHLRIVFPSKKTFEADAADWDFRRTVHKAFRKMESELEHEFHISDQHQK